MAPRGIAMRPQRSIRMLHEDPKISYDELIEYKHSTRMELADHILDDLIAIAEQSDKDILKRSAAVLKVWDKSADSESRGALLFHEWMRNTKFPEIYSVQWNESSPLDTPKGISDKKSALEALEKAASSMLDRWGALDIKWGEVHRFQHGDDDYPGNGGTGFLGIFRVVHYVEGKDSRRVAAGGDSFYAAVEFSEPLKVNACLVYGNY
jgi:acyl-homoserine-lactone acylase